MNSISATVEFSGTLSDLQSGKPEVNDFEPFQMTVHFGITADLNECRSVSISGPAGCSELIHSRIAPRIRKAYQALLTFTRLSPGTNRLGVRYVEMSVPDYQQILAQVRREPQNPELQNVRNHLAMVRMYCRLVGRMGARPVLGALAAETKVVGRLYFPEGIALLHFPFHKLTAEDVITRQRVIQQQREKEAQEADAKRQKASVVVKVEIPTTPPAAVKKQPTHPAYANGRYSQ